MIEIFAAVGLALTAAAGIVKLKDRTMEMAGPRVFSSKFKALTKGENLVCQHCGVHLGSENTGVLYSDNGKVPLGVCREIPCVMWYMHSHRGLQAV